MSQLCSTLLPSELMVEHVEHRSLRLGPPICFVPPELPEKELDKYVHKMDVEISPKITQQIVIFNSGIADASLVF